VAQDPRAGRYLVDHVPAGTTRTRHVEVSNGGDLPVTLGVYAGAAGLDGGRFSWAEGRAANELTSWMTVSPAEVTLAPGEKRSVEVAIAVPAGTAPGERYAVVWAHRAPPADGGVAQSARVGVRTFLSVRDGAAPETDFAIESFTGRREPDGRPVVEAMVRNVGPRSVDLTGRLELSDGPGGLSAQPYPTGPIFTVDPGERQAVLVPLDPALPAGEWDARMTLQSGPTERTGEARLELPSRPGTDGPTVALVDGPTSPWPSVVFTAVLGVVVGGVILVRRRRPTATPTPTSTPNP
jgi:hypothetical protein